MVFFILNSRDFIRYYLQASWGERNSFYCHHRNKSW